MLLTHFATDDFEVVRKELGIEGWADLSPKVFFPDFEAKATERPAGTPWGRWIWRDSRTYEDGWGVVYRVGEGDWYEERVSGPLENCETVDDVLAYDFPTVEQIRDPEDYAQRVDVMKRSNLFVGAGIPNP